jgi:hypothetical protein
LEETGSVLQVENALPYGILSKLSGAVKTITVGLPYALASSSGVESLSSTSFKMSKNYSYINVPIPKSESVTVYAKSDTASVTKYGLGTAAAGDSIVVKNITFGTPATSVNDAITHVAIYGITGAVIDDFRVMFTTPSAATIKFTHKTIEIPDEVRKITGYGAKGAYLDLTERKFYDASGKMTNVSEMLPEDFDIIPLLPGAIIRFNGADDKVTEAGYTLTYKSKI